MEKLYSLIDSYYDSMVATLEKMVNIDSGADCPEGIKAVAETWTTWITPAAPPMSWPSGRAAPRTPRMS